MKMHTSTKHNPPGLTPIGICLQRADHYQTHTLGQCAREKWEASPRGVSFCLAGCIPTLPCSVTCIAALICILKRVIAQRDLSWMSKMDPSYNRSYIPAHAYTKPGSFYPWGIGTSHIQNPMICCIVGFQQGVMKQPSATCTSKSPRYDSHGNL